MRKIDRISSDVSSVEKIDNQTMHNDHDDENETFFIDTEFDVREQEKLHVENFESQLNLVLTSLFQDQSKRFCRYLNLVEIRVDDVKCLHSRKTKIVE